MCKKRFARLELLQEDSQNFWGGGVDRTLGIGNVDEEADIDAVQGEVKVVSMSKRIQIVFQGKEITMNRAQCQSIP